MGGTRTIKDEIAMTSGKFDFLDYRNGRERYAFIAISPQGRYVQKRRVMYKNRNAGCRKQ